MDKIDSAIFDKVTGYAVQWVKTKREGNGPNSLLTYWLEQVEKHNTYLRYNNITLQTIIPAKILQAKLRYSFFRPSGHPSNRNKPFKRMTSEDFYREMEFVVSDPFCVTGIKTIVRINVDYRNEDFKTLYNAFRRINGDAIDADAVRKLHRRRNAAAILKYLY